MEQPIPNGKVVKRVLTVSIPRRGRQAFMESIEDLAKRNEYSLSEQVRVIIKDALRKEGYEGIK